MPLPPDLEDALTKRLEALTGARIVLEKRVDPAVIGGVAVVVGDSVIDGTVRSSLQHLRERLLQVAAAGRRRGLNGPRRTAGATLTTTRRTP